VVLSKDVFASDPSETDEMFEPANTKVYRHPTFYEVPDGISHM
jgi:ring-1,2-phenylacetyl-CoA epoxidase subunit PaaB